MSIKSSEIRTATRKEFGE